MLGRYENIENHNIKISITSNKKQVKNGNKKHSNWYRCHDIGDEPFGHCSIHKDNINDNFRRL